MSLKLIKYGRLMRNIVLEEHSQRCLNIGLPFCSNQLGSRTLTNKTTYTANITNHDGSFRKNIDVDEKALTFDNSPDRFGTLSQDRLMRQEIEEGEEEDDVKEIAFLDGIKGKTRLKPINYAMMIKQFLKEKKLADALGVLEHTMLEEHKAKPDLYIYNLLIGGCAQYGYTKKAFQLFNQMKKREIRPRLSTYTSLFNACSNGPWAHDALERAHHLRQHMIEKGIEPNPIIYNSMIKAFGRHGDLITSFSIMDEMISKNIAIDSVSFNFLLQASASDKQAGFRHALLVWKKLLDKKIMPTLYTFNLLLRCTRDCGTGDTESTQELLSLISPPQKALIEGGDEVKPKALENVERSSLYLPAVEHAPLISVSSDLRKPWHRLILLGDFKGIFHTMSKCKVQPDIKTFTLLIQIAPNSDDVEQTLIEEMKKRKVKIDIDFCNMLIKKRNSSVRFSSALGVLQLIREERLSPNIVTYGVLAMGCNNLKSVKELVKEIYEFGFRLNIEILTVFLTRAKVSLNIDMVLYTINKLTSENIVPDEKFYRNLTYFKDVALKNIELKKSNETYITGLNTPNFDEKFSKFLLLMENIKGKVKDPSSVHPWEQFKVKKASVTS